MSARISYRNNFVTSSLNNDTQLQVSLNTGKTYFTRFGSRGSSKIFSKELRRESLDPERDTADPPVEVGAATPEESCP